MRVPFVLTYRGAGPYVGGTTRHPSDATDGARLASVSVHAGEDRIGIRHDDAGAAARGAGFRARDRDAARPDPRDGGASFAWPGARDRAGWRGPRAAAGF